ncbi:MAG: hypothetical protein ACRD68_01455 [Pyrinomonadaceae bacterium]
MSEFLIASGGGAAQDSGEHSCKRIVTGDVESVRRRLAGALEALDYRVLSEQPLHARRAAQKDIVRADILEYGRKLTIALKPLSPAAALATFDFEIMHAWWMTKGDARTLEREAEAIIALATAWPATAVCAACGTDNSSDSRFCRMCGAPTATGAPAELEVVRLTAGARASHQEIVFGVCVCVLTLAAMLPLILLGGPKGVKAGWIFLIIGEVLGLLTLFYGMLRLHRTLNGEKPAQLATPASLPRTLSAVEPAALRQQTARASVTEGTTELLASNPREPVAVPLHRKSGDTDPIG